MMLKRVPFLKVPPIETLIGCHVVEVKAHSNPSRAGVGKHVGGVTRNACIDTASKKLVDEHDSLNSQLSRRHHNDQLWALH